MKVNIGKYLKNGKRRETVEIDRSDTYSLYYTLALLITPCLKEFISFKKGYPSGISSEEWDLILNKMLWSFQEILKDEPTDFDEKYCEKIQEGLDLFGKWYLHLWW